MENCANYRSFLALFCICFFFFLPVWGSEISPSHLSAETQKRFSLVPEFAFIMEEAEKLGVKVYLFGGTASAFAHYVRWDLEREAGDDKYQKERFDYDFTNIYRGNQDLDIVIDGTAEQAQALRQILQKNYPHFMGEREAWEVRLLREPLRDKKPLLDDYDFKNQHTDTNSTGMLALTPSDDEIVYRDLLDWNNPESEFLTDVASAKIKFIYNDKHNTTSRFKEGKNPPILAAIRYLAKLTQYEVEGTPKDLETVKQIIARTRSKEFNPYVRQKTSEFGLKALLNAPDVEYAWNLLEETGARKLLIEIDGKQFSEVQSLSWWFNKEPLKSFGLGQGEGETAREIFGTDEIIISHETNSFVAYENITRSAKGRANVFISRNGIAGEAAIYGDGFYTQFGREGARGTGLTIRFKLNPDAREGVDFVKQYDYIIVKNKNALTLIQENLNLSIIDYFKLLDANEITENDKGLIAKFNRKFGRVSVDSEEFKEAAHYLYDQVFLIEDLPEHMRFDFSGVQFESFEDLVEFNTKHRPAYQDKLIKDLFALSKSPEVKHVISQLIDNGALDQQIIKSGLHSRKWSDQTEWIDKLLAKNHPQIDALVAEHILTQRHWQMNKQDWMRWMSSLVEKNDSDLHIALFKTFKFPQRVNEWSPLYEEWFETLLDHDNIRTSFASLWHIFNEQHDGWFRRTKWLAKLIDKNSHELDVELIVTFLPSNTWTNSYPELIERLLEKNDLELDTLIAQYILSDPTRTNKPEWISRLLEKNNSDIDDNLVHSLTNENWKDHPEFIETLLNRDRISLNISLIKGVLKEEHWNDHPEWIEQLIDSDIGNGSVIHPIISNILAEEHWSKHPQLVLKLLQSEDSDIDLLLERHIFKKPAWKKAFGLGFNFGMKITAHAVRKKIKRKNFLKRRFKRTKGLSCEKIL